MIVHYPQKRTGKFLNRETASATNAFVHNNLLLDYISDAVIFTDMQLRVVYFNKSAEQIYDIHAKDIIGCMLGDIIKYQFINDSRENALQILLQTGTWQGKVIYTRKDKRDVYLLATVTYVLDANGKQVGIIATLKDISSEELISQKARSYESHLHAILNNTRESLCLTDSDFNIIVFNRNAAKLMKRITEAEMKEGANLVDIVGETRKESLLAKRELLLKGESMEYEVEYADFCSLVNIIPIKDQQGKTIRFCFTVRDITERKQTLKDKIEQHKEINRITIKTQENERNELGRELHDNVNQILAVIKLQLEYALENYDEEKPTIERCKTNIENVITEIRHLSHRLVLPRFAETSLQCELQKMIHTIYHQQRVHLEIDKLKEQTIPVNIKETLYRIIQEQLSNIIKHAKANNATITLRNNDTNVALQIEDDGQGFNLSQSRNGVGITNILNRMESYNGTAKIATAPGNGCRLLVTIPLKEQEY